MKLFLKILCISLCAVALLGFLIACDGGDDEPKLSQTDVAETEPVETPTNTDPDSTKVPVGDNTGENGTPNDPETVEPSDTDEPNVPTDTTVPSDTTNPEDTTKPEDTTTPEKPEKPNWNELPKVDPEVAYTDNSVGYVDGVCVTHTNYNSRNMILGARYEIIAHERYYVMTKFTYAENGPLTELYVEVTGEPRFRYVFEYDESGELKSSKFFYLGKEKDMPAVVEYHSNGLLKKVGNEEFTQEFDKLGRLVYESMGDARAYTKFTYSGDSRRPDKVEVVSSYEAYNQELTPVYSADGQVSEIKEFYLKSKQLTHYKLEYATNGRVSKIDAVATDAEGNVSWRTVLENTYDERSNPTGIVSVTYNADGSVNRKQVYGFAYDDRDNIIEENYEYYVGLTLSSGSQEKREFDQNGRCIKSVETQYDANGITDYHEYLYEYYVDTNVLKKDTITTFYIEPVGRPSHLTVHEYYENGRTMKSTSYSYDREGNITDYHLTENNAEGETVKQAYVHIHEDGEMFWGGTLYEEEYDANGKIIKITETDYNAEGKVEGISTDTRNYDENGKLRDTEEIRKYPDGTLEMKANRVFDENEKEISSVAEYFKEDGSLNYKYTYEYTYHENGNRKSSVSEYYENGNVRRKEISRYDENGNGIGGEVFSYNADGVLTERRVSEAVVDEKGNEIGSVFTYYDGEGNVRSREVVEYERYPNGTMKRETQTFYNSANTVELFREWHYNENGECISETSKQNYFPNGNAGYVEVTEYDLTNRKGTYTITEYDIDGNVIYTHTENFDI